MTVERYKRSGIYAIYSEVNGRRYVGSAVNISGRWRTHRYNLRHDKHRNPHLQNAWNKYGEDAFEFVVLEECPVDQLLEREQHYIDMYPDKYNCLPFAGSRLGVPHSDETKAKMSETAKRRKASPEARANMSAAQKGNRNAAGTVHSIETRARWSETRKGRKLTSEARANVIAGLTGRTVSPETRSKISAAMKAYWSQRRSEAKKS